MNFQGLLLPIALIVIMYVVLILPQRKREKKTKEMLEALQVGNDVVTIGGLVGKVISIKDDEITIETGSSKIQIIQMKWSIREVINQEQVQPS